MRTNIYPEKDFDLNIGWTRRCESCGRPEHDCGNLTSVDRMTLCDFCWGWCTDCKEPIAYDHAFPTKDGHVCGECFDHRIRYRKSPNR